MSRKVKRSACQRPRKNRSPAQRAVLASARAKLERDNRENIDPSRNDSSPAVPLACLCPPESRMCIPLADHDRLIDNVRRTVRRRDLKLKKIIAEVRHDTAVHKAELSSMEEAHQREIRLASQTIHDMHYQLVTAEEEIARLHRVVEEQQRFLVQLQTKALHSRRTLDALHKRTMRNSPWHRRRKAEIIRERAVQDRLEKRIFNKGAYTAQARALIRELIRTGCSEKKAGALFIEFGRLLGIKDLQRLHAPSARSSQRFIAEGGVAADMQTGMTVALNQKTALQKLMNADITSSSDSTTFRHQNYNSNFLALRPVSKSGELSDESVLHALGISASVDHSSAAQLSGYLACLEHKFGIWNRSPMAQRMGLYASLQTYALNLKGTNGDHAADVRKSNQDLEQFKSDMTVAYLGSEQLKKLSPQDLVQRIIPFARAAISEAGGSAAWVQLSGEERAARNLGVMEALARSLGRTLLDRMNPAERGKLSRFLWSGCCMHKELNSVKGGDEAMRNYYDEHPDVPRPVLLANRDNAAVLRQVQDGEQLTSAEMHALVMSSCGAIKATTLGGMICNNKDKKKGQHDTYVWFFQTTLGLSSSHVFPDVSNTQFQSHCDAACEIVCHLATYRIFMQCVYWRKDKPGFTNVEQNFYNVLYDVPTLTEMCVLVLYANCITYPYARRVRGPGTNHLNALELGPYHADLKVFVRTLISNPDLALGPRADFRTATFDKQEMHRPLAYAAVRAMQKWLPVLRTLFVVFLEGALVTWERFTSEFVEGGIIDQLSNEERSAIFVPATNDANESALGTVVASKRRRPNETLNQFNARYTYEHNHTRGFMDIFQEADEKYIHKQARLVLESLPQAKIRKAQTEHDSRVAAEHQQKEAKKALVRTERWKELTRIELVLNLRALKDLSNEEMKHQLDVWRYVQRAPNIPRGKEMPRKKFREDALRRLITQYPAGKVPDSQKTPVSPLEAKLGQPIGPTVTRMMPRLSGPRVSAGSSADGQVDGGDALYDSEDDED
ncbi:uncharacterized protein SCHCODRAFT_01146520 [Schizophyllum commune H4-8]|uniref:Uncharacterized protein n=1 Tax=Schizophyllum commune (strain H4-8 / FGSC 9210) TaxID=578458 RepID=D8PSW5_SCHCM|nr:uncharacterized protein SCHCODRAFT_01146520 [Schizophyllum commune H4-8]KAI5899530.1 hypothetical protein SCHCODRAFT_01146520 [Schizophyllum commune H4-8]